MINDFQPISTKLITFLKNNEQFFENIVLIARFKIITLQKGLSFNFHTTITEVPEMGWVDNFFLSKQYLQMMESAQPVGMKFKYLTICIDNEVVAFFYFQIIPFNASNSLQVKNNNVSHKDTFNSCIKSFFSNFIQFNTLVVGNLTLTGPYAFQFHPQHLDLKTDQFLNQIIEKSIGFFNKEGENISLILLKDFPFVEKKDDFYFHKKYFPFCIDPDMNFNLKNNWFNTEDYIADFTTKYRTRYNRAKKKLGNIFRKDLNLSDVIELQESMYQLYLNVAEKADFNTVYLNNNYFLELKKQLGEATHFFGYFLEDKLVSFVSMIKVGDKLEAHYIGYEPSINADRQIYLNMLYDIVDFGISNGFKKIGFARTASEIKSSVGATASQYYCYLKHTKPIINRCIPALFQYFTPVENWKPRNPFKQV
jgi:hypothetical protein